MRTRSAARSSWFESSAPSVPLQEPVRTQQRTSASTRRRLSSSNPSTTYHPPPRRSTTTTSSPSSSSDPLIQPTNPAYPTTPNARLLSSDAVLRNVAFVAVLFTLALMFLNIALYIGVITVGVLVPAWRTFKTLEFQSDLLSPPSSSLPDIIQLDDLDDEDDDINNNNTNNIENIDDDYFNAPPVPSHPTPPPPTPSSSNMPIQQQHIQLQTWHKYWVLTAGIFAFHAFFIHPLGGPVFIPYQLYLAAVLSMFSWLNSHRAANAARVYDTCVKPTLARSEHAIDVCVETIVTQLDSFTKHVILGVNQAVEPYARQLEMAAQASRREMENRTRRNNIAANYFN